MKKTVEQLAFVPEYLVQQPAQLRGGHFLQPASLLPIVLVEVVSGTMTMYYSAEYGRITFYLGILADQYATAEDQAQRLVTAGLDPNRADRARPGRTYPSTR